MSKTKLRTKYRNNTSDQDQQYGNGTLNNKSKDSDSDDESAIQLQSIKREVPCMEIDVEPNDTLQAIAVRFHCTVAEVKRLNNIHKENEIYAKRSLKVPVRPHSILSEKIIGVHISGGNSPIKNTDVEQLIDIDTETLEEKLKANSLKTLNSQNNLTSDLNTVNSIIFNSNLLTSNVNSTSEVDDNEIINEESVELLPSKQDILPDTIIKSDLSFRGDDCGLSWIFLVALVLILVFVCPLVYVFYIAEHLEEYHKHQHHYQH